MIGSLAPARRPRHTAARATKRTTSQAATPAAKERVGALDGIRAIAVLAVVGFHFGLGWLQGGFFGVDVFYVLSGFLITGLLLAEYRRRDKIALRSFWLRRARRLLPCLFLVLIATTLCVRFLAPAGTYPGYRMNALSALFYFSNWWQIAISGNYFVANGPVSPLTHTWSLAIEEQFYLVWPLIVLGVLHFSKNFNRGVRRLLVLSSVGAIASAVEMAILYNPDGNTTRLYFGTDTHAQSVLVGAALACATARWGRAQSGEIGFPQPVRSNWRYALGLLGLAGLGVIVFLSVTLTGNSASTYQGGFILCAAASGALIIGVLSVPSGVLSRVLSLRPLVWLGMISYGVYLWHFPVDVFVTAERIGFGGIPLMAIQFSLTIAVSAASFLLVERPIMRRTFWRSIKSAVPAATMAMATVAIIWIGAEVPTAGASGSVHSYTTPPAGSAARAPSKVVVLGDSTALTLGLALSATAPKGTAVANDGLWGCGIAVAANASNTFSPENSMFSACNEDQPPSKRWTALDRKSVQGTGPGDVILFVSGHWETQDLLIHGRWTDILSPRCQRYELREMRTLAQIATAHGAHLELFTMPPMARTYPWLGSSPDAYDISSSAPRRQMYNRLLRETAASYPNSVSVVDYGSVLAPRGTYIQQLDGIEIRSDDGVHTPAYAPGNPFDGNASQSVAYTFYNWMSPRIWPQIISRGHTVTRGR